MSRTSAHESNGAFVHPDPKWLEELKEKVSMYLDRDFETLQEDILHREIYSHPLSIQLLQEEQSFRNLLRDNYKKQSAPPQLATSILQKIKNTPV